MDEDYPREFLDTEHLYTRAPSKMSIRSVFRCDLEMICRRGWPGQAGADNGWEIKEMARGGYCGRWRTNQSSNSFIRRTEQKVGIVRVVEVLVVGGQWQVTVMRWGCALIRGDVTLWCQEQKNKKFPFQVSSQYKVSRFPQVS